MVQAGGSSWHLPGEGNAAEPSVSVSLELEVAGERAKRIKAAEENLAKVRAEVAVEAGTLALKTKPAFFDALYFGERLDVIRANEALSHRLSDVARERLRSGETTALETDIEVTRYLQSRKVALVASRDYQNALDELKRLIGSESDELLQPSGQLTARPIRIDSAKLLRFALASRADLRASEAEISRLEAETALTKRRSCQTRSYGASTSKSRCLRRPISISRAVLSGSPCRYSTTSKPS